MARKSSVQGICFMLSGCLTSLWSESRRMDSGVCFVRTKHLDWPMCMAMSSRDSMKSTREQGWRVRLCLRPSFGSRSLMPRSRLVLHTCSTRMRATSSQIRRTWARSRVAIFVLRLSSTRVQRKRPFATWHRLL